MSKKLFLSLLFSSTLLVLLVACASINSGTQSSSSTPYTQNSVHTSDTIFVPSLVRIKKGESVTLVADTVTPHSIANGMWDNGTAKPITEPGTPVVKDVQLNGNGSETLGPFPVVGVFKLYCTIHPGMNLTVVVQ